MKTLILNSRQIGQKINRIAYEIYENNYEEKQVIIAGIAPSGYLLASRIADVLKSISPIKVKLVKLEVDKEAPYDKKVKSGISSKDATGKVVVVVDDVLNSGKTLMYGVKHFLKSPVKKISTAVLVDRDHPRYPIKADYAGMSLSTTLQEHISVELKAKGKEAVYLM